MERDAAKEKWRRDFSDPKVEKIQAKKLCKKTGTWTGELATRLSCAVFLN